MTPVIGIVVAGLGIFAAFRLFRSFAGRKATKKARTEKLAKQAREMNKAVRHSLDGRR